MKKHKRSRLLQWHDQPFRNGDDGRSRKQLVNKYDIEKQTKEQLLTAIIILAQSRISLSNASALKRILITSEFTTAAIHEQ